MKRASTSLSILVLFSIFSTAIPTVSAAPPFFDGPEVVTSESIAGGGSAFVFRSSRKQPQDGMGVRSAASNEGIGGRAKVARSNAQIAAAAKKRKVAAAVARKKAVAAAANKKIAASNALTAKAEKFLDGGQSDLAITSFRAALVQNPKNVRATTGLSDALTEKGIVVAGDDNNATALVYFDEAVKLDKKNDVAFAKRGAIFDASGDSAKAIANYESAIAINPELAGLQTNLGLAYLENGDTAKAESSLQKAEAGGADTIDTRTLRGLILFKQNKNDEALKAFDRVLELDSRNASATYHRGQIYEKLNQKDKSIAAFRKSLELEPGYGPAAFDLGVAYYNSGDYKNAESSYQNAIRSDPKNYQAHANLASTYRQLERYPEANAEYKIASDGIKTADLYSEWGFCLGKTNEWVKAAARLQTARELSPTAIDNSNVGWAYYNAGAVKAEAKDDAGAKAEYSLGKAYLEKAVQQDPKLDAAYLNLGSTHNGLGEFQAAVTALNVAVGLRKNWVVAINQLGLGYRGMNDLTNAVATFKQVTQLDGNNVFGLFNLGEAYNASGNKKEAKKVNDKLKRIDPALASRLEGIFSGKAVINDAKNKIENKIPKLPRFP